MKQLCLKPLLSMLLIMCIFVTTFSFIGGEKASAAGNSFFHSINQSIYTYDPPIDETMTVTDADLPEQTAHLLIYANDVDEKDGEWDFVYWNGEELGMLSGQNEKDSTSVFQLDIGQVELNNNLQIEVTNGLGTTNAWLLNAYWAQLVIDGGPVENAEIASLEPRLTAPGAIEVEVSPRAIEPGDYYLEANLIDEAGFNQALYTQTFLGADADQLFERVYNATGLPPGKYTANAILYSYDNSQTRPADRLGLVQHIVTKTIDTRLVLDDIDLTPIGGSGNVVLSPAFNPYTTEYSAAVPFTTTELTPLPIVPSSLPADAILEMQINGGGFELITDPEDQADIPLQIGRNIIEYKITSPDDPDGITYTITIDRAPKLDDLLNNPGTVIAPDFDGDVTHPTPGYKTVVANPEDTIVLTPQLPAEADPGTTISIKVNDGPFEELAEDAAETDELPLNVGRNTIIVRVTSPDGFVYTEYPVIVDRGPALASPGLSEGDEELAPEFSSDVYEYVTVVGHTSTPITLTPTVNDGETIEIRVNSDDEADYQTVASDVTSADLDLLAGTNKIEVRVKSPDYDSDLSGVPSEEKSDLVKTYTFTIIRNPFLTNIEVEGSDLKESFAKDVLEHETAVTVPYTQKNVNVTPTTTDAPVKLEIRINGGDYAPINSGELSEDLPLRSGVNTIEVKATSTNPNDDEETEYSTVYTVLVRKSSPPFSAPSSQITAGKDGDGQNLLVTDIIGRNLSLTGYLLKSDGSKLDAPSFLVDASGNFELPGGVAQGKYSVVLTVNSSPEQLAGHVAQLDVDNSGVAKGDGKLIDPRSKVTDAATGKALEDVTVTLYWADTEHNLSKGRTPGEAVKLPQLGNFAPHKNSATQVTLADGVFGWVPFVDGDYYFIAEKEGYTTFDSRQDNRNGSFGEGSTISGGTIHIGKSLVTYNFSMKSDDSDGVHDPYMKGYPDGEFKPQRGISRAELAEVLSRIIPADASASHPVSQLTDLATRFWASASIDKALQQGWLKGYTDGTFKPNNFVTRAEMAQVIYNIYSSEWAQANGNVSFEDVEGHWGATAIKAAANQGLLQGDTSGNFRPNDAISRAEAVTMFNRLLGRTPLNISETPRWSDVNISYWAYKNIMEASVTHEFVLDENEAEIWVTE